MQSQIGSAKSFESDNYSGHYFRHRSGEIWKDEEDSSKLYKEDSTWFIRPALNGQLGAISLESVNYPGHFLRHAYGDCWKHPMEDTQLYRDDASWVMRAGLAGKGTSLESSNYPSHYMRHQGGRVKINEYEDSELYKRDATWIVKNGLAHFESGGVEEFKELMKDVTGRMGVLSNAAAFEHEFGFTAEEFFEERERCAEKLHQCANYIAKVVHDTGVARTVGGAAGIASGAAIIGGILAAPFTAGTSLALTAGGIAAGVGSAATTITASIVKDKNVQNTSKEVNKVLEELKPKDDKVQKFMEELGIKLARIRDMMSHDKSVLEWMKFIGKDIIKGIGYNVVYKGYVVYESVKAARFATAVAEFIQADFYAMQGVAIGASAPGLSVFGRTLIVAGSSTAKILGGVLGIVGIGFGIWDIVEGQKDVNGSETADEMHKAANKMEEVTKHYRELVQKLRETVDQ